MFRFADKVFADISSEKGLFTIKLREKSAVFYIFLLNI